MRFAMASVFILICPVIFAATIHVPADIATIQEAINTAANGDMVLVAPGTYVENIRFKGKAITVMSEQGPGSTLIDGGNPVDPDFGSVVLFDQGEGADSVLEGFTLINGTGTYDGSGFYGGGIFCQETSPTITGNVIMNNSVRINSHCGGGGICCYGSSAAISMNRVVANSSERGGGGVYCDGASPAWISNNIISENTALYGGGIYCWGEQSPTITGNLISKNRVTAGSGPGTGGGVCCYYSSTVIITNSTITDNWSLGTSSHGGGVCCLYNSDIRIYNSIIWDNFASGSGRELSVTQSSKLTIRNSDVMGGQAHAHVQSGSQLVWGQGMIDEDPLFVDSAEGDYHIQYGSLCRDAGSNYPPGYNNTDFEGDPRIGKAVVDMGFDEFYTHLYCTGDFMPNGSIEGKFVGTPGIWPVGLFLGSGVMDPPLQHKWGLFYLESPWLLIPLVPITANGVLVIPATIPPTPAAPYDIPMQALIGAEFTNLFVIEVNA